MFVYSIETLSTWITYLRPLQMLPRGTLSCRHPIFRSDPALTFPASPPIVTCSFVLGLPLSLTSYISEMPHPAFLPSVPCLLRRHSLFQENGRIATRHFRQFRRRRSPPRASLLSLPQLPSSLLTPLSAATPFSLTFLLLSSATLGLISQSNPIGKALSPPVVTTLLTLLLSNLLPLPSTHPVYSLVNTSLVPLAVPLLLFGADLRRVFQHTTRLVLIFIIGSAATVLGTLIAWKLIPLSALLGPSNAWKIAAALCARHIGGAVNYVAVAEATSAHSDAVAAALAADNVITALYFVLLLFLARNVAQPRPTSRISSSSATPQVIGEDVSPVNATLSLPRAGIALSLSAAICALGVFLDALFPFHLGPIPVITALTLCLATTFPRFFDRYRAAAAAVGVFFMQIFFAATGIAGSLGSVLRKAPLLLLFSSVQLAVHLASFWMVGRMCRFERSEILIASNANVGGPTTAAGMAAAKGWDRLLIPGLLIGVFGYSIATFVSLAVGHFLLKPA